MALSNRSKSNSPSDRSSRSPPRRQNKSKSKQVDKRGSSPPLRNKRQRSRSGSPRRRHDRKSRSLSRSPRRDRRTSEAAPENKKLFITNIQGKYSQQQVKEDLKKQFEVFGKIYEIVVKTKQNSANTYAFIEFERIEDAIRAQENMKNKRFKGKELKVEFGRNQRKKQDREGQFQFKHSGQCYYCHKTGHFARQCREKDRYEKGRSGRDYDERRRSRDKDRHRRRHRDSYSHSRSSTPERHRKRRSRSRSPRYQERRRYDDKSQRYGRDTRDGRDGREGRSSRDVRGPRDQRDYREYRDGRGSKDVRDSREKGGRDEDREKKKQRPRYNIEY